MRSGYVETYTHGDGWVQLGMRLCEVRPSVLIKLFLGGGENRPMIPFVVLPRLINHDRSIGSLYRLCVPSRPQFLHCCIAVQSCSIQQGRQIPCGGTHAAPAEFLLVI